MRISGIANTAATPADSDYIGIDGSENGTRKFALFTWLKDTFVKKVDVSTVAQGGTGANNGADACGNLGAARLYDGKVIPEQASSIIELITEDHTLLPSNSGHLLKCLSASDIVITVPTSDGFDIGTEIEFVRYGAGGVTFEAGSGVTICVAGGAFSISYRYNAAILKLMDTNEWYLNGDLT